MTKSRIVDALVSAAFLLTLFAGVALAKAQKEDYYVNAHCEGRIEVRLRDRTRVDCLTATHAIEYDFSDKWKEGLRQARHYAHMTGKAPKIVLICRRKKPITCRGHMIDLGRAMREAGVSVEVELITFRDYPQR